MTATTVVVPAPRPIVARLGIQGPPGPQGPAGSGAAFEFLQGAPSDTWVINHNLGHYVDVTVLNTGGAEVLAEVIQTSVNQAIVYLNQPIAGRARCV